MRRHSALRVLLARAAVVYVLLRGFASAASSAGGADGSRLDNPFGLVILVTILGAIDIRRRGETMLWGNLAYERWQTWAMFGGVAAAGEILIAILTS